MNDLDDPSFDDASSADIAPAYTAHLDTFTADHLPPREEWPVFRFELPELQYPERLNCGEALLDAQVERGHGARRAVGAMVGNDAVFATYDQLLAQANRIARVLTDELGLVPGNRVLLRAPNNPMLAACWLAVMKAGLVAVPTMPLLRAKELKQILVKARVAVALCDAALYDEIAHCMDPSHEHHVTGLMRVVAFNGRAGDGASLEERCVSQPATFANVDTARDDVCMLAFTSGTTGEPKATMHFHRDVMAMCDTFCRHVLQPGPDDVFIGTPPIAFTFGLGGLLCFPLSVGASTFLVERATPESLLEMAIVAKATIVFTAPTFYRQMAQLLASGAASGTSRAVLDTLAKSVSAGEALPDATRQLWKNATGIEMIDGIGGTEVMHIYIAAAGTDVRRGAIGKVVPGFEAVIVDDAMQPQPPGTVGRLALRGPTGCRYLADPRQRDYVKAGWNLPGDAFVMDDDGYFFYQARTDDMIVSAGYNIASPEVESALLEHAAVKECAVIGVEDEVRGQVVKAFVLLNAGHAPSHELVVELQTFVKSTVAPYKYPRQIEFVDVLPRTETGKLQRFRLRQTAT